MSSDKSRTTTPSTFLQFECRLATTKSLQDRLVEFVKSIPAVKDFSYTWTLWQNWEKYPPVIAIHDKKIIGMLAITFSKKTGYLNLYYIAVDFQYRGYGVAQGMIDYFLGSIRKDEDTVGLAKRLKIRTVKDKDGEKFFRSLGLEPYAEIQTAHGIELVWHCDVADSANIHQLIDFSKSKDEHDPVPEKEIKALLKRYPNARLL